MRLRPAGGQGLPPGTLLRITGGHPSPEESAAILLAVDLSIAEQQRATVRRPRPEGWRLAARLEGVGIPGLTSPVDVDARHRALIGLTAMERQPTTPRP
jgi:hypothetical protein